MVSDSCPARSLSDSALIAAQAHTRRLYLVQRGNRDKRYYNGVGWVRILLAESPSRLYPHMRAKCGRDPTAVSKKVPFNFISRWKRRTCNLNQYDSGKNIEFFRVFSVESIQSTRVTRAFTFG